MKYDSKKAATFNPDATIPASRNYQLELLEESLKRNIVIALDTGSGKTHIAVLRIRTEVLEREQKKLSWFIAPTVALVEQQRDVIATHMPVSVGLVSNPDQWKDSSLWRKILETHRVMVTTPQVLLDSLRHGYVNLGADISLLVFDECHHTAKKHPYNMIMEEFYRALPPRGSPTASENSVRPMVLGLTASPIFGGNPEQAFREIEANMDATIFSTRQNREELSKYVPRPAFKQVQFRNPEYTLQPSPYECKLPSHNFTVLQEVVRGMDIQNDPWVQQTRASLARLDPGPLKTERDQELSKAIAKQDTSTHRSLRKFLNAASVICVDIGPWAADWYVAKVVEMAKLQGDPFQHVVLRWQDTEKRYLMEALEKVSALISISPVSYDQADISAGCSNRLNVLVEALINEKVDFETDGTEFSGIVFVTRRDTVIALAEVLQHHPSTKDRFRVGSLLGSSSDSRRTSFLDITRGLVSQTNAEILSDFRSGHKNLIVSTCVAEEGIDVQSCCSVVRWDLPQNMISWAQSRGRARKRKSTFVIMTEVGKDPDGLRWEELEKQMVELYNDPAREFQEQADDSDDSDEKAAAFRVEKTGATLTLHSAISHLNHFCAVLPSAGYAGCPPVYETDPPEFPEGWHSTPYRVTGAVPAIQGPFGAKVYLPRHLPAELREFTTLRVHRNKPSAKRHVAYQAYKALYDYTEEKWLNDHLLPFSHLGEDMEALFAAGIEKRKGFSAAAVQMNPWSSGSDEERWWAFKISIDQLQDMILVVRRNLPRLSSEELPILYIPGRGAVLVNVEPLGDAKNLSFTLEDARKFTRRLLWRVPGSRSTLDWAQTDFEYLLHPVGEVQDPVWDERWRWASEDTDGPPSDNLLTMDLFGIKFEHPSDITYVCTSKKRDYRFIRWRNEPLSEKEEERIRQGYAEGRITYPLLEVRDRGRKDFTIPFPAESNKPKSDVYHDENELLVASRARLFLASPDRSRWAALLPSLFRQMSINYTVISFRDTLLASTPLYGIPLESLTAALTAPAAEAPTNYERMETLGDTVLKLLTSIQAMADHPFWHEGYLTSRKDHVVANVVLARSAMEKGLPQWIIRDPFIPTTWSLLLRQKDGTVADVDVEGEEEEGKKEEEKEDLSTKTIADVVEALIGASYVHGSFDWGTECVKLFGFGMEWQPLGESVEKIFTKVEPLDDAKLPMILVSSVEKMLGYEFTKKTLAVEALTHPSYNLGVRTRPYDRLEFLGDAVLDMAVTHFLYNCGKNYNPVHMHLRKVAVTNQHFLAFICLDRYTTADAFMARTLDDETVILEREENLVYLWQCLLQSNSHVMEDMSVTCARYQEGKETITKALKEGKIHPWAALTALQAPKFFSDIVESLLGAIYLDCRGDMDIVRKALRTFGILPILERIVNEGVDVLHPVSRLAHWADKSKPQKLVKYNFQVAEKRITCTIVMEDKPDKADDRKGEATPADLDRDFETVAVAEAEYRGHGSEEEVKFEAAERAIQALEIREVRSLEDAKMDIVS